MTGKKQRNKGAHSVGILTVNGRIHVRRTGWWSVTTGHHRPVDARLGLVRQAISLGVVELCCHLNRGSVSFRTVAENLKRAAGISISAETLRGCVEDEGRLIEQLRRQAKLTPSWEAGAGRLTEGPAQGRSRVYLSCDGVHVPVITHAEKLKRRAKIKARRKGRPRASRRPLPRIRPGSDQGFKELKVLAFYDQHKAFCHSVATCQDHRHAGRLMRREADRLGWHHADERVSIADGARWIQFRMEDADLKLDGLILDFYHFSEHVHAARRAVFGDTEGYDWADEILHIARHDPFERLWAKLEAWRKTLRGQRKREAADNLMRYLITRKEMVAYAHFRERGWDIGSGPIESQCKTVTQRIKGRGRRWNPANIQAIANLTAILDNGEWNHY